MSAFPPPPPKQSSCANCARELPLKLVLADNGRRYWLCGGCEAGMRQKDVFGREAVHLPHNRWNEHARPSHRPPTPQASARAPTMDEQERRVLRSAKRELSLEEELQALKDKRGSR